MQRFNWLQSKFSNLHQTPLFKYLMSSHSQISFIQTLKLIERYTEKSILSVHVLEVTGLCFALSWVTVSFKATCDVTKSLLKTALQNIFSLLGDESKNRVWVLNKIATFMRVRGQTDKKQWFWGWLLYYIWNFDMCLTKYNIKCRNILPSSIY